MSGMPKAETLVQRLRGIYAVGKGDPPEFGFRQFDNLPAIQSEAANRIEELERELSAAQAERNAHALAAHQANLRAQAAQARIAELEAEVRAHEAAIREGR